MLPGPGFPGILGADRDVSAGCLQGLKGAQTHLLEKGHVGVHSQQFFHRLEPPVDVPAHHRNHDPSPVQPDWLIPAIHKSLINTPYQTFYDGPIFRVGTLTTWSTQNQGNLRGGRVVCPRKLSSGSFFSTIRPEMLAGRSRV